MPVARSQTLKSFSSRRKSESKGRKEKAAQRTMGVNENDQKISATIMTNNKLPKMLFCITKEEIRLNGPIINLLKIHIHIYIYFFYLNRKIDYSEMHGHSMM